MAGWAGKVYRGRPFGSPARLLQSDWVTKGWNVAKGARRELLVAWGWGSFGWCADIHRETDKIVLHKKYRVVRRNLFCKVFERLHQERLLKVVTVWAWLHWFRCSHGGSTDLLQWFIPVTCNLFYILEKQDRRSHELIQHHNLSTVRSWTTPLAWLIYWH